MQDEVYMPANVCECKCFAPETDQKLLSHSKGRKHNLCDVLLINVISRSADRKKEMVWYLRCRFCVTKQRETAEKVENARCCVMQRTKEKIGAVLYARRTWALLAELVSGMVEIGTTTDLLLDQFLDELRILCSELLCGSLCGGGVSGGR